MHGLCGHVLLYTVVQGPRHLSFVVSASSKPLDQDFLILEVLTFGLGHSLLSGAVPGIGR